MSTHAAVGDDPLALLGLARRLAAEAGALALHGRAALDTSAVGTKSTATDLVTEMDRASERLIVDGLRAARPDDAVVGEEGGAAAGRSGISWFVDPIDGTVNYVYGIADWSVSVAAWRDGDPLVGVVCSPARGETFHAVRGGGAYRNDRPIRCSDRSELATALVATGFGYDAEQRRRQAALVSVVLPQVRDVRRFGSAALDLCSVACGRVDAYYEHNLHAWDTAAGILVAEEAGARTGGLHGERVTEGFVAAAPPALFEALLAVLRDGGAGGIGWYG